MKKSLKACEKAMANATDYVAWREAALEYDRLAGLDEWRESDISPHYDYELIRMRLNELKRARARQDVNQLVFCLREGLHGNLGNIANPRLYAYAKFGTKHLIVEYLDEVVSALDYICDNECDNFNLAAKAEFFKSTGQAFGYTAFMMSGGAGLGLFHIGVIRALWKEGLVPKVVSGSSAGSLIASIFGTHDDSEIADILDPAYLYTEAFKLVNWKGLVRKRSIMCGDQLELFLARNIPEMTFEEAYQKTGRLINISVSPLDPHQKARLLNYRTSPNVLVHKAALASCAIPGVFPPVMLWAKNIHGETVPYIPSRKWVDGSIKDDLPVQRLNRLYGINHTIVSQTNPHVTPFISRGKKKTSLYGLGKTLFWDHLRLSASHVLGYMQNKARSDEFALMLDKAISVVSQRYVGDINIIPPRNPLNFRRILANPSTSNVAQIVLAGERKTWPEIERIRNTTRVGRAFEACQERLAIQRVKRRSRPAGHVATQAGAKPLSAKSTVSKSAVSKSAVSKSTNAKQASAPLEIKQAVISAPEERAKETNVKEASTRGADVKAVTVKSDNSDVKPKGNERPKKTMADTAAGEKKTKSEEKLLGGN